MTASTFTSLEKINEKYGLQLQIGGVVTVAGRKGVLKRVHAAECVEIRFDDTGERTTVPVTELITKNPDTGL